MADEATVSDSNASGAVSSSKRVLGLKSRAAAASESMSGFAGAPAISSGIERILESSDRLTESNINRVNELLGLLETVKKREDANMSQREQSWRDLYADVLMYGRKAQKDMKHMSEQEKKLYKEAQEEHARDFATQQPKKRALLKMFLTDISRDAAKALIKNPFLNMFSGFQQFRGTVAGKPLDMMVKGLDKAGKKMVGGLKKTGQKVKKLTGDIWSNIINMAISGLKAVVKFFQTNVFKVFTNKISELKAMFMNFPGAVAALENLRKIQDTIAEINQQFGGTRASTQAITNDVRNLSNAYLRQEDILRASNAVLAEGVRNSALVSEYTEDTARYARAMGESDEAIAGMLVHYREYWSLSREETEVAMSSILQFNKGVTDAGLAFGVSTSEMNALFSSNADEIQGLIASGESLQNIQNAMMVTATYAANAQVDPAKLNQLLLSAGKISDTGLFVGLLGDPQHAQDLAMNNTEEFFRQVVTQGHDIIAQGPQGARVFQEAFDSWGLGLSFAEIERLYGEHGEGLSSLSTITDIATASWMDHGNAVNATDRAIRDTTPRMDVMVGKIEELSKNIMIGKYNFGEFLGILDESDQMMSSLMGGFEMVSGGIDMTFGPASGIVKMLTTFPLMIAAFGGVFGDFTDTELEDMGMLGGLFKGIRDFKDTIWEDELKPMLESMWNGIVDFFDPQKNGGRSMFRELIDSGVDWVTGDGATSIVRSMSEVATELMGALGDAFTDIQNSSMGTAISSLITDSLEAAIPLIKGAVNVFTDVMSAIIETLTEVLSDPGLGTSLGNFVTALMTGSKDALTGAGGVLQDFGSDLLSSLWTTFKSMGEVIFEGFVDSLPDNWVKDQLVGDAHVRIARSVMSDRAMFETGEISRNQMLGRTEQAITRTERYRTLDYINDQQYEVLMRELTGTRDMFTEAAATGGSSAGHTSMYNNDWGIASGGGGQPYEASSPSSDGGGALPGIHSPTLSGASGYDWRVTSPYLDNSSWRTHLHHGVDLVPNGRNGADVDVPALMTGEVVMSNFQSDGYGNVLKVLSTNGQGRMVEAIYAHLDSRNYEVGDVVEAGDSLGLFGNTGSSTGAHLHFEVREGEGTSTADHINPMPFVELATGGVVLREAVARIGEQNNPEIIMPLDQYEETNDRRNALLVNAINQMRDDIVEAIENGQSSGVVDSLMGYGKGL